MKKLVIGILAHVDAGKTTLSEGILYLCGSIRRLGRVDHKDAFLDTNSMERERGITIFSKQAVFPLGDMEVTLLDTPGHVDFSAEMERTLQVLDYAILVINGADGVQAHTQTLWRLLNRYQIPVILFINKMDQEGTDQSALLQAVQQHLDERCINFQGQDLSMGLSGECLEEMALCSEQLLEMYTEQGNITLPIIQQALCRRQFFPCYFGSALKLTGVSEFLQGISGLMLCPEYPSDFGARIFKITRDAQGNRLTHMKMTGGSFQVKDELLPGEKVNQIRVYSGEKYDTVNTVLPGTVCAVTGLETTFAGQGLGIEGAEELLPILEPVLTYQILLPEGCDVHKMLSELKKLEEEEPELHIVWNESLQELHVQLMGEIQLEILKRTVQDRFGVAVQFDAGRIVYKETIADTVEGVGHFEPLRHYAEVHLRMEPGEPGSGLEFAVQVSEDDLDRNWQRLILTHLEEKVHLGVLTGSPITDMKITLIAGRAHQKHTEGGDFRQATYRAIRQGLMEAKNVLLEPFYDFRLELPAQLVGRGMNDMQKRSGSFRSPEIVGETAVLSGKVPVAAVRNYQAEVAAYTGGRGRLFCSFGEYGPCHNPEEVMAERNYNPEGDLENPSGSVFCSHGAGFVVPWDQVKYYMHLPCTVIGQKNNDGTGKQITFEKQTTPPLAEQRASNAVDPAAVKAGRTPSLSLQDEKELEEIFTRTYGTAKPRTGNTKRRITAAPADTEYTKSNRHFSKNKEEEQQEYLLVDGYNIIFAWDELRELSEVSLDAARGRLMDMLCNYQGYRNTSADIENGKQQCTLILVFDAYKVAGNAGSVERYQNIYVVYTKEAETADQYIEKTVHEIGRKYRVTVATSDRLEQVIIFGQGANRLSATNFYDEVMRVHTKIQEHIEAETQKIPHARLENFMEGLLQK